MTAPKRQAFRLSVVVPVYNERNTVTQVLDRLELVDAELEIIVVDDGSTDGTSEILDQRATSENRVVIRHERNSGKGQAVRTGLAAATGTHVLVFDADTEYDPADIPKLIAPLIAGRADVVYGVRLQGQHTQFPTFIHKIGNSAMTVMINVMYGTAISDLHTCLKLLPLPLLRAMELTETGFGLDTEITCELLRHGFRPYEVPVSYVGRSVEEGKKIKLSDALECALVAAKVRRRRQTRPGLRNRALAPRVA